MSLFRQIAILVSLIFIALLSVTTWNNFRHSSDAMEGQLQSAAQSMATTLGVVIANAGDDPTYIETLFNVIFDSGYLANITLKSPSGDIIHSRQQAISVNNVPNWLVELVPMQPATGQTIVMKDWVQYGTLQITLHPGHAYAGLYKNLKSTLLWFGALAVAGLLILAALLHNLLQPLRYIRKQADAIMENRFVLQEDVPRTTELRRVSQAMNRMVGRVKTIFSEAEEAETLNRYHQQLYHDALTGLGNRRHFIALLDDLCHQAPTPEGCIVAIYLHGISATKEQKGYKYSDQLIVTLSNLVLESTGIQPDPYCARISSSEFAFYQEGDIKTIESHTRKLIRSFIAAIDELGIGDSCYLSVGITSLNEDSGVSTIMSDIEFTLAQAKASGKYVIYYRKQADHNLPRGRTEWRNCLSKGLQDRRYYLVVQPSYSMQDTVDHYEAYVRLKDEDDQVLPAGDIMPMANELDMNYDIEHEVFSMALRLRPQDHGVAVAVNLSSGFFKGIKELADLEKLIQEKQADTGSSIQVEINHFTLVQHIPAAPIVIDRIRRLDCSFGVDNLDLSLPLDLLQQLRPDYVKINAQTLLDIYSEDHSEEWDKLRSITSDLNIRIIATGIDTREILDRIKEMNVDGLQGYFIGKPEEAS